MSKPKRAAENRPPDALALYRRKRDFSRTPEPSADAPVEPRDPSRLQGGPCFVIQKHWARRLHYDFRLEIEGTMKSWAIPKGPSLDPSVKRMAVHVEDHPLSYNDFEGTIPEGEYGAGKVIVWDRGHWSTSEDPGAAYRAGKLKLELAGCKLRGRWALVRMGSRSRSHGERGMDAENSGQDAWLLIKEKDAHALPESEFDVIKALPDSVIPAQGNALPPDTLSPQLATRVSAPPTDNEWIYELKYDGYRILARVANGQARLMTRSGHDWTVRLQGLAGAIEAVKLPDGWYDGEIVVLDKDGRPDFQALQNALDHGTASSKGRRTRASDDAVRGAITYFLFDLPWTDGRDLRREPLDRRQARLAEIMQAVDHPALRLSIPFDVPARDILASACRMGLEGIIGKRRTAPYVSGRSGHWIKLKCGERQEFVVGGYTDPKGGRSGLGSLLLGYYDDEDRFRYAGNVGSGFSDDTLQLLHGRLLRLRRRKPSFDDPPSANHVHWVEPRLAVEVAFSQWTNSGRIRHAVFRGLREDKDTTTMKREHARRISNPGRMVDRLSGTRKADVATFYERIAPLMMPHLKDRPVALLRAPEGIGGELFFQKHLDTERLRGFTELDPDLNPGHAPLVIVDNAEGLAEAAQLNVVEFHTWNAVRSRIDRPDRIAFDLDPGEGVKWSAVQEAAHLLHGFLGELGLQGFVKTSGGKGLHVIVPIMRRYDWDTAKGFSRAVVEHMAAVLPDRYSAKSGPRNRVGKIFIDYLRNGFGATTVAAWSLRARPGMGVSVPIHWAEVDAISGGDHWTIASIDERLDVGNEPWANYGDSARALGPAMKRLS